MSACTIYIVEDEGILAMNLETSLSKLGYEVAGIAYTAETALEEAGMLRPDIVLMDITLKGKMSGIEAAHRLKEMGMHIIFITGNTDQRTINRAMLVEPDGFLKKPMHPDDIRQAIEKVRC